MNASEWDRIAVGSRIQLSDHPNGHVVVLKEESLFVAVAAISLTDVEGWHCQHQHREQSIRNIRVGDEIKRETPAHFWIHYYVTHVYEGLVVAMHTQVIDRTDTRSISVVD